MKILSQPAAFLFFISFTTYQNLCLVQHQVNIIYILSKMHNGSLGLQCFCKGFWQLHGRNYSFNLHLLVFFIYYLFRFVPQVIHYGACSFHLIISFILFICSILEGIFFYDRTQGFIDFAVFIEV